MTPQEIAADVARGIELKRLIATLGAELKAIEKRLESAGLEGAQIPLLDATREGKQFLARGTARYVPVRFESDQLIASFSPDTEAHKIISAIAGEHLPKFFVDVRRFERVQEDGNTFRKLARATFPATTFAEFINACISRKKDGIPKSRTVVAWDDAAALELAPSAP